MELNKILIGVVMVAMISAGMVYLYDGGVDAYSPSDYDDSTLQALANTREEVGVVVGDAESNITDIKGNVDQADASEVLLTGAFKTAVLTGKSVPIIHNATQRSISELPITNDYARDIIGGLMLAVLIIFIVGILMNIATKSPRT